VYGCTDLENNQRFLKALKDDARKSVKSLLIHPSNANAVMEQLRFRYGRPEQLIRSQLNSIRDLPAIREHNLGKLVAFATHVSNLKDLDNMSFGTANGSSEAHLQRG